MNKLKGGSGISIKSSCWNSFNGDGHPDKDFLLNTDSGNAHQKVRFSLSLMFFYRQITWSFMNLGIFIGLCHLTPSHHRFYWMRRVSASN